MKLVYKLIIIILLSSVVSVTAISIVAFTLSKSAVSDAIKSQQLQLAKQTMDKIDRLLHERYNDVQTIAGDQNLKDVLINFNQNKNVASQSAATRAGFPQRFQELNLTTGPWDDFDIIAADGTMLYSTDLEAIGKNTSDEPLHFPLFKKAMTGESNYSDAVVDPERNKPTLVFAVPVRNNNDPTHKIIGVVITQLSWQAVLEILGSIKGPTIDMYNVSGINIANNDDPQAIFKENEINDPTVKAALQGKEQSDVGFSTEAKVDTVNSSVTEKGFSSYKGNKWILIVSESTSLAFAPAVESAKKITLYLIPIILGTSGLLLFLILRQLNPINLLTQVSNEIAAGDLSKRAKVTSKDEIGELGLAFNTMADHVQELNIGLEQKVKERTTELEVSKSTVEQKLSEVEKLNDIMIGRELKMVELKKEIATLKGENPKSV